MIKQRLMLARNRKRRRKCQMKTKVTISLVSFSATTKLYPYVILDILGMGSFSWGTRGVFDAGKSAQGEGGTTSNLTSMVFGSLPKFSAFSIPKQSSYSGQGGAPENPSDKECKQVFFDCAL